MAEFTKPIENLVSDASDYVDLKIDEVKLKGIKGLSLGLGHLLAMILVLFSFSVVLLALAFGWIMLMGQWIGSYAGGAFIMAGVFLIITLVLLSLRAKLFTGSFVRLFSELFFGEGEE